MIQSLHVPLSIELYARFICIFCGALFCKKVVGGTKCRKERKSFFSARSLLLFGLRALPAAAAATTTTHIYPSIIHMRAALMLCVCVREIEGRWLWPQLVLLFSLGPCTKSCIDQIEIVEKKMESPSPLSINLLVSLFFYLPHLPFSSLEAENECKDTSDLTAHCVCSHSVHIVVRQLFWHANPYSNTIYMCILYATYVRTRIRYCICVVFPNGIPPLFLLPLLCQHNCVCAVT